MSSRQFTGLLWQCLPFFCTLPCTFDPWRGSPLLEFKAFRGYPEAGVPRHQKKHAVTHNNTVRPRLGRLLFGVPRARYSILHTGAHGARYERERFPLFSSSSSFVSSSNFCQAKLCRKLLTRTYIMQFSLTDYTSSSVCLLVRPVRGVRP